MQQPTMRQPTMRQPIMRQPIMRQPMPQYQQSSTGSSIVKTLIIIFVVIPLVIIIIGIILFLLLVKKAKDSAEDALSQINIPSENIPVFNPMPTSILNPSILNPSILNPSVLNPSVLNSAGAPINNPNSNPANDLIKPNYNPSSITPPSIVDAVISPWSSWSSCDKSCGGGSQTRTRTCLSGPQNGGKPCETNLSETQACNTQACVAPTISGYEVYDNYDLQGSDIDYRYNTASVSDCATACNANTNCKSFTYATSNFEHPEVRNLCFLKNNVPQKTQLKNVISAKNISRNTSTSSTTPTSTTPTSTTPTSTTPTPSTPTVNGYEVYNNYDLPGFNISIIDNIDSANTCANKCSETGSCRGFTYVTPNFQYPEYHKKCFIKTQGTKSLISPSYGLVTGEQIIDIQLQGDYSFQDDSDMPGSNIEYKYNTPNVQTCLKACNDNPNCKSFTYSPSDFSEPSVRNLCFIKNAKPGIVPVKGLMSGKNIKRD